MKRFLCLILPLSTLVSIVVVIMISSTYLTRRGIDIAHEALSKPDHDKPDHVSPIAALIFFLTVLLFIGVLFAVSPS